MTTFTLQQLLDASLPAVSTDGNGENALTEFSRSLTPAEWNTYLTIADPERAEYQQLKDAYADTIAQLKAIEDAVSPTNAQVIAAVKYLAKVLRLTLRFLVRLIR